MPRKTQSSKFATTIFNTGTETRWRMSLDKGGGTNRSEGPIWDFECLIPADERRNEQLYIDTRGYICSLRGFKEDIRRGQANISAGFNKSYEADSICENWRIREGKDWVLWLLDNWDTSKAPLPHLSLDAPKESFPPWMIQLDFLRESEESPPLCRVATLTLNAGLSKSDAHRVIEFLFSKYFPGKRKGGRPRLTDQERESMLLEFSRLGIPKPSKRKARILKVQALLISKGFRLISETAIGNELRKWLSDQGETVRRYAP